MLLHGETGLQIINEAFGASEDANYPWLHALTSRSAIAHEGQVIAFC